MKRLLKYLPLLVIALAVIACKKKDNSEDNPYDSATKKPNNTVVIEDLDPTTIQGLHQKVFLPTCANSGCHDGTFEPDFRTIESSYYSLIYNPITKNNPAGDFEFRVVPGNADKSVLIERLINDIDGQSGIMPLVVEPTSDWDQNKTQYIQNIRTWINNGAADANGDLPVVGNIPPTMAGVLGYLDSNESTKLNRLQGDRELIVNPNFGEEVILYFAFTDDNTDPKNFTDLGIRFSSNMFDYGVIQSEPLEQLNDDSFKELGYNGVDSVTYTHKAIFTTDRAILNQSIFFRVTVNDGEGTVEIPQSGSFDYILKYFGMNFID